MHCPKACHHPADPIAILLSLTIDKALNGFFSAAMISDDTFREKDALGCNIVQECM
jgi:hypothetical protein